MKKKSLFLIVSILGLNISSCSYLEAFNDKRQEEIEAAKPTIQIKAKAEGKAEETPSDPMDQAVKDAEGTTREQETVGLLKSTNPEIRVRESIRGRQDPFSTIIVKPEIEVEPEIETESESSSNRNRQPNQRVNNRTVQPNTGITSTPTIDSLETPEEPPEPPTELAENVIITGLIEIGDRIKVILQAPGEATSRYVNIGQYVSNGEVLVKRVEYGFPAPTVILEQSGVEVAKVVGQSTEETGDFGALLPSSYSSAKNTSMSDSWLSNHLFKTAP